MATVSGICFWFMLLMIIFWNTVILYTSMHYNQDINQAEIEIQNTNLSSKDTNIISNDQAFNTDKRIRNIIEDPKAKILNAIIMSREKNKSQPKHTCLPALSGRNCAASKLTDPRGKVCFAIQQKFIIVRKGNQCEEAGYWFFDPANCVKPRFIPLSWNEIRLLKELKKMGFERVWWKSIQSGPIYGTPRRFRIYQNNEVAQSKQMVKMHLFGRKSCEKKGQNWECTRHLAWPHFKEIFKEDKSGIPRIVYAEQCQKNSAYNQILKKKKKKELE